MKFYTFIFLFFALITNLFSQQENYSVHQQQQEEFGIKDYQKNLFLGDGTNMIPLQYDKSETNNITIFGYLPDWQYQSSKNYLRYDLLTHIACFDFAVDSIGNISYPAYWPWNDVINTAHQNGVKIILTAVNFNSNHIHNILTNDTAKTNFFDNLQSIIQEYKLDGVNIDFENLLVSDRGTVINSFMSDLNEFIKFFFPDAEVSFASPPINWSGWNFSELANACDYLFIMGYAFTGSWSTKTGGTAPLYGGTYNISNTINIQYANVVNNNPKKLILGVPYYGEKWETKDSLPHSPVVDYISSTRFQNDYVNANNYGLIWANDEKNPWYKYKLDSTWVQVWFDNDSSLGLKYSLVQSKNLRGIGMWALGYDGSRTELWNEIEKIFYPIVSVEEEDNNLSAGFYLSQNYPNPYNPTTKIRYYLLHTSFVTLKVYDILGQEVATIVNEEKPFDNYEVEFSGKGLSSGIYFYRLEVKNLTQGKNFNEVKKMILLK